MIIDLDIAIAILLSSCLLLVFSIWIFYNLKEHCSATSLAHAAHQCPYCTQVFETTSDERIQQCPTCKSLLTIDPNQFEAIAHDFADRKQKQPPKTSS